LRHAYVLRAEVSRRVAGGRLRLERRGERAELPSGEGSLSHQPRKAVLDGPLHRLDVVERRLESGGVEQGGDLVLEPAPVDARLLLLGIDHDPLADGQEETEQAVDRERHAMSPIIRGKDSAVHCHRGRQEPEGHGQEHGLTGS
jgi:hypothetical protein